MKMFVKNAFFIVNVVAKKKTRFKRVFLVELRRVELLTSCMPCRRSTN